MCTRFVIWRNGNSFFCLFALRTAHAARDVQGKIAGDRHGFRGGIVTKDKCPRNSPFSMLGGGLPEVGVGRVAAAIEGIAVVRSQKEFELKHAPHRRKL